MNMDFINNFGDRYMKTPGGQGAFLAGVLLGYMALKQVGGNEDNICNSPLFKQIQFGRLDAKGLKKLLSRVPQLIAAYREDMGRSARTLTCIAAKAGELLLMGEDEELGTEGNFAFAVGFTNANEYYWKILQSKEHED